MIHLSLKKPAVTHFGFLEPPVHKLHRGIRFEPKRNINRRNGFVICDSTPDQQKQYGLRRII
jgi:hypothetical protein